MRTFIAFAARAAAFVLVAALTACASSPADAARAAVELQVTAEGLLGGLKVLASGAGTGEALCITATVDTPYTRCTVSGPAGLYHLEVSAPGYRPASLDVTVQAAASGPVTAQVPLHLEPDGVLLGTGPGGGSATLAIGDRLTVELGSLGDMGYGDWTLDTPPDPQVLELVSSEEFRLIAPPDYTGGYSSAFVFAFRAVGAGQTSLRATTRQGWEGGRTVTFDASAVVEAAPAEPPPLPTAVEVQVSGPGILGGLAVAASGAAADQAACVTATFDVPYSRCSVRGPAGSYHLEVTAPGYRPASMDVTVVAGADGPVTAQVPVTLEPEGAMLGSGLGEGPATLAIGDRLTVELGSLADAGYDAWILATPPDPTVLELTSSEEYPLTLPPGYVGGFFSAFVFTFRAVAAGQTSVQATARQSWEGGSTVTFEAGVIVE